MRKAWATVISIRIIGRTGRKQNGIRMIKAFGVKDRYHEA